MPSARRAGVPPEVLKEWEADFRQKKAEQAKAGTKRLPSGSVQYEYDGVIYTAKYVGKGHLETKTFLSVKKTYCMFKSRFSDVDYSTFAVVAHSLKSHT